MFNWILEKLSELIAQIPPFGLFVTVLFIGMVVFWRGLIETRKDRSSIFDAFFFATFFGIVVSRIAYILSNWMEFSTYIWYILPYERYGSETYWFRLLPWKFINVFDGGLEILIMFVSFLSVASLWTLFVKKWRWNHVFPTIYFSAEVMLALSYILTGVSNSTPLGLLQGGILLIFPVISLILITIVNKTEEGIKERNIFKYANLLLIPSSASYILLIYFQSDATLMEKSGAVIFFAWAVIGLIYFLIDLGRAHVSIERVSSVRTISPLEVNQPIKLPKRSE